MRLLKLIFKSLKSGRKPADFYINLQKGAHFLKIYTEICKTCSFNIKLRFNAESVHAFQQAFFSLSWPFHFESGYALEKKLVGTRVQFRAYARLFPRLPLGASIEFLRNSAVCASCDLNLSKPSISVLQ